MTISKKLAFFLTCALSMQFVSHAYDAVGLKTEVAQILDFTKECYKYNTPEAKNIAEWLEKNIDEYNTVLRNADVIAIAKTLNANTTIDAKLMIISQIMVAKAKLAEQHAIDQAKWANDNKECVAKAMEKDA